MTNPSQTNTATPKSQSLVIQDLQRHLTPSNPSSDHFGRSSVALPVAAIKTLLDVIQRSHTSTMMGLQLELQTASNEMLIFAQDSSNSILLGGRSHIALASGCELFLKYITRCFLELQDFTSCKEQILERGQRFSDISQAARERIATVGKSFIRPNCKVLTHGWSRVVSSLLLRAKESQQSTHFEVYVLEGRPDASGAKAAAKIYGEAGIPTTIVLDSAMAHIMEKVDLVIVGAEGVMENGGVINKIGTYALAICAMELGKPFYVAAESFKFARLFPLNQSDLPEMGRSVRDTLHFVDTASWVATGGLVGNSNHITNLSSSTNSNTTEDVDKELNKNTNSTNSNQVSGLVTLPSNVKVYNPPCDYTPAKYITLLFTDLGVLTPSAVSDELIRLYQ